MPDPAQRNPKHGTPRANVLGVFFGTERTEVTLAVPDGLNSLTISGSGSAAELQLEQAEAASRYNLLQNTDMDSAAHWTGTGLGAGDGISTDPDDSTAPKLQLDDSVLKLEGGYDTAKSYTQTLSVSGGLGDDYSFGAWVKSGSVSLSNKNTPDSTLERHCGIRVRLLNGSTEVDSKLLEANTLCPEWQFLSGSVRASGAYDTVEFSFLYDYNANESYFDGAQLFREKFAYVYDYDDEGRITRQGVVAFVSTDLSLIESLSSASREQKTSTGCFDIE